MATPANIAIDLSNGETVAGSISPGYRLVIATNESSSNIFSLNKWAENHPVMVNDSLCVEYYRQSSLLHIIKVTPYNITGRFFLRLAGAPVTPASLLLSSANKIPVYFRISAAQANFTMTITAMSDSTAPVVSLQSQKQEEDYRLVVNLPDSRFGKQYVVAVPDDGQGHMLSQGDAPMVKLPYYAATAAGDYNWKL